MDTISTKTKLFSLIGLLALLLVGAAGGATFLYMNQTNIQQELKQKSDQLKKLNDKMIELSNTNDEMKKKLEFAGKDLEAENERLKSSIAAFAKQAASCDAIKKKLHAKD